MSIENFIEKLNDAIETRIEEKNAREKYTGYEWDCHGICAEKRRIADEKFGDALNEYIHDVINNQLKFLAEIKMKKGAPIRIKNRKVVTLSLDEETLRKAEEMMPRNVSKLVREAVAIMYNLHCSEKITKP